MNIWNEMQQTLDALGTAQMRRVPAVLESAAGANITIQGRSLICLCSNDYLSLANDPSVKAATIAAIERWGVGAGASRLVSGTMRPHVDLETRLRRFKGTEAAIVTSTGWMANHAAICTMAGEGDLIVLDKLNHASIFDAARTSRADLRVYAHRDTQGLTKLLQKRRASYKHCLIVTESLFSMDGDFAPLVELAQIKQSFDAQLLIDEAHATGIFGETGRGVAELLGVEDQIDATVGTLSKALGTLGGFVAGPRPLIETIRNRGRSFVYTTAPPPAICAGACEALRIVQSEPQRRLRLLNLADEFRRRLNDARIDTTDSQSQIIPVLIGSPPEALRVSARVLESGFFIPAIRPPTVPSGTSRLRISICSNHAPADLETLSEKLVEILQ